MRRSRRAVFRWILLTTALTSFAVYGKAVRTVFSRKYGVDPRMRALQAVAAASAVVHLAALWTRGPDDGSVAWVALGLYGAGLGIFLAARRALRGRTLTLAFSPDLPEMILNTGVYGRIRHPFYTAYTLTWLAGLVAVPSYWTGATAAGMFAAYWYAASLEEAKFARSALAGPYADYRGGSGMFWPGWGKRMQRAER